MKSFIDKITVIFLLLVFPTSSYPNDSIYEVKGNIPLEFINLIKSYQEYELTKDEKKSLKELILFFDKSFSILSKEEVFQIVKSQIYKNIINFLPLSHRRREKITFQTIKDDFNNILNSSQKDHFKRWLISALKRDLDLILKNKSSKNNNLSISLISKWHNLFIHNEPKETNQILKKLSKKIFKNLKNRLNNFLYLLKGQNIGSSKEKDVEEMAFFKIKQEEFSKNKSESKIKSRVLKILEPITEESLILPGMIQAEDKWVPREGSENININPPKPDPNYMPPGKLPIPKNDW